VQEVAGSGTPVHRSAAAIIVGIWVRLAVLCALWVYEALER